RKPQGTQRELSASSVALRFKSAQLRRVQPTASAGAVFGLEPCSACGLRDLERVQAPRAALRAELRVYDAQEMIDVVPDLGRVHGAGRLVAHELGELQNQRQVLGQRLEVLPGAIPALPAPLGDREAPLHYLAQRRRRAVQAHAEHPDRLAERV